ncbi:PKD domain-containing protein [archaeon]
MNKFLPILISMLLLTSMVSAAFVGGNFNALQDKLKDEAAVEDSVEEETNTDTTTNSVSNPTTNSKENIIILRSTRSTPSAPVVEKPDTQIEPETQEVEEQADTELPDTGVETEGPETNEDEEETEEFEFLPMGPATGDGMLKSHSLLVVGLSGGDIYAYDSKTNQKLWENTSAHGYSINDIKSFDGKIFVASTGKVTSHNRKTGEVVDEYNFASGEIIYSIDFSGTGSNKYLYAGAENGRIYKIRMSDDYHEWKVGETKGKEAFPGTYGESWNNVYAVAFYNNILYVAGGLGYVDKYSTSGAIAGNVYYDYGSKMYDLEVDTSTGIVYYIDSTSYSGSSMYEEGDVGYYNTGTSAKGKMASDKRVISRDITIDSAKGNLYTARDDQNVSVWSLTSFNYYDYVVVPVGGNGQVNMVAVSDNHLYIASADKKVRKYTKSHSIGEILANTFSYGYEPGAVYVDYTTKTVNEVPEWTKDISEVNIKEDSGTKTLDLDLQDYAADFEGDTLTFSISSEDTTKVDCTVTATGNALSVKPTADWYGTAYCTVRVSDGNNGNTADKQFKINVESLNDQPYIHLAPLDMPLKEGDTGTTADLNGYIWDKEDSPSGGGSLTFTLVTVSDTSLITASITGGNKVTFSATSNKIGSADITVKGTDFGDPVTGLNVKSINAKFTVTVSNTQDAPYWFNDVSNITINEDSGERIVDYNLGASGSNSGAGYATDIDIGDTLTYNVVYQNENEVSCWVNGTNNKSLWVKPAANWTGTANCTVRVDDGNGGNADSLFYITVTEWYDAPWWATDIPDITIQEDQGNGAWIPVDTDLGSSGTGWNAGHAMDIDKGDVLTYSVDKQNAFQVECRTTGTNGMQLEVKPAPDWNGTSSCTIEVKDKGGWWAYNTFVINVTQVNDFPEIKKPLEDRDIDEDTYNNILFDDLNDYFNDTEDFYLDFDATLPLCPEEQEAGGDATATEPCNNVVNNGMTGSANTPGISNGGISSGPSKGNENGGAVNPDDDDDGFGFDMKPLSFEVDPDYDTNLVYVWANGKQLVANTTTLDNYGSTLVSIRAFDSNGDPSPYSTFNLTVNPVNDAPDIDPIADMTQYVNEPFAVQINASDVSSNAFLFTDDTPLFDINGTTGWINDTPQQGEVGSYLITITATETPTTPPTTQLSDTESFTLTIVDREAPDITISFPEEGQFFNYTDVPLRYSTTAVDIEQFNVKNETINWFNNGLNTQYTFVLDEGPHKLDVQAVDNATIPNTAEDNRNITVDLTAPNVWIYIPPNGATVAAGVNVTWNSTDNYGVNYYFLNGTNMSNANSTIVTTTNFPALSEGSNTMFVTAYDYANNTDTASVTFTLDTTPPTVSITYPTNGSGINMQSFNVNWTGNTGVAYYMANGTNTSLSTSWPVGGPLAEDNHTYTVIAYDSVGNSASANVYFEVDVSAPNITLDSPLNMTYAQNWVWVNATVDEDASWCAYSIDAGANQTMGGSATSWYYNASGLVDGNYSITVYCNDTADNFDSATEYFGIDTTLPTVAITFPDEGLYLNYSSVNVTWTGNSGVAYFDINGTNVSTNMSQVLPSLGEGSHNVVVTAVDAVDNNASDNRNFTIDLTPPSFVIDDPTNGTDYIDGNVQLNWTGTDNYGVDHYTVNGTDVGNVSTYDLSPLSDDSYVYFVTAYDMANNTNTSVVDFTVNASKNCNKIVNSSIDGTYVASYQGIDRTFTTSIVRTCTTVINSTIFNSTLTNSTIIESQVNDTSLTGATVIKNSFIDPSDVQDSTVSASTVLNSTVYNSTVTNFSTVIRSYVEWSTLNNSTAIDSRVINATLYMTVVGDSNVTLSDVNYSTLANSTVTNSTIVTSNVTNSTVLDSTVTNSTLVDVTVTDANITDGWLESGCVTFGTYTYCVPPNPRARLEDIKKGNPPVADASVDQMVPFNTIVSFDGSNSTDEIGITSYSWAIVGGATIGTGVTQSNNFTTPGLYTVQLTVTDVGGLTGSDNMTVAVYNGTAATPDVAVNDDGFTVTGSPSGTTPTTLNLKVYNLANATADNFTVRMNYTSVNYTETNITLAANSFTTVSLQLMLPVDNITLHGIADFYDDVTESNESNNLAVMTLTTTDFNDAPTAVISASATSVNTNQAIAFGASGSTDGDGTITSYQWDFGDSSTASGITASHSYPLAGTYVVTLTVTDDDSATDTDTVTISVSVPSGPGPTGPSGPGPSTGSSDDVTGTPTIPGTGDNETEDHEAVFIDDLVTYEIGQFIVTRDYFYDPLTGDGWYTINVENTGDDSVIRLEDPNPYNADADTEPDYTDGNRFGWELDLSAGSSFEVTYSFDEELTTSEVKGIGLPIIEDITPAGPVPTATPEPEEETTSPLTGLLTFLEPEFWSSWVATLVMLALLVFLSAGWIIFKEQGYSISLAGTAFGESLSESPLEELDFNQPSGYAEGTLY